jgi:hypothetical protein
MKKNIILASFLLASLAIATAGYSATISWSLPASYSDGTPIAPEDVGKILTQVYTGPAKDGPWKLAATSPPGATSLEVEDPPPGHTLWYTVRSSLHGAESGYAEPVQMTNLSIPIFPSAKNRMGEMTTGKKTAALLFLLLLGVLVSYSWYRGKRGKR